MGGQMKSIQKVLLISILTHLVATALASTPCALRETKYGSVCVCNATYCDFLDDPTPVNDDDFIVISSTKAGLRFAQTDGSFNRNDKLRIADYEQSERARAANTRHVQLNVDRAQQYQKIVGFGGSFTGAVSYILQNLPQALQDHIYESFYAKRGIGFNLMRMSIGGCDFDLAPWAYNEQPENDTALTNFADLDARDQQKAEQIKRLKEVSQVQNLRIKGAAWSAPRWMKSSNKWAGFSHLKKEYYQTWADYHVKWLELMEKNELPVWAISTGNEPMNGYLFAIFVKFMSMGWTPKNQGIWLSDHLGPTIRNSKFKDVLIFGNDDQRYTFPSWFHMMKAARNDSVDYLDGMVVHWYFNEIFEPVFIDKAHAEMPEKLLISSESCVGDKPWQKAAPLLGSWKRGEKYARAFLQDLQHNFNGWIDWNIILNEQGGPNYVDNTVDAPVIANMTNLAEVYKQPIFYAMGHFTKFIPEGSVRIDAVRSNINIDSVAFLRPDGSISVVLFNSGKANVEATVVDTVRGSVVLDLPPSSIHTLIYK